MPKYLRVAMSDKTQWDIPLEVIAKDRATYYVTQDANRGGASILEFAAIMESVAYQDAYQQEYAITMDDTVEAMDWANNNMNWSDIEDVAILVRIDPVIPDYASEWSNAPKVIVDEDGTIL